MAVLDATERAAVSAMIQRDLSAVREVIGPMTKADLLAAVNAADQWAEDNKVSYNTALPLPARTALTTAQKARLLTAVIRRRYEVGS